MQVARFKEVNSTNLLQVTHGFLYVVLQDPVKILVRVGNLWEARGGMKGNPPPQLPHHENWDCSTVHTQRINHTTIPLCNAHISRALSPYHLPGFHLPSATGWC